MRLHSVPTKALRDTRQINRPKALEALATAVAQRQAAVDAHRAILRRRSASTRTIKLRDGSDLSAHEPNVMRANVVQARTCESELVRFYGRMGIIDLENRNA